MTEPRVRPDGLLQRLQQATGPDRELDACRHRAYEEVRKALIRGDLVRPEKCERCGRAPGVARNGISLIQGHHHQGYDKPLEVEWLCAPCHRADTPSNPLRGSATSQAKLRESDVLDIRASAASTNSLARTYGVSRGLIYMVRNGKAWTHVA